MPEHSFSNLMRRLSRAGFKENFVRSAILPDWWTDSYSDDLTLLPEIEIRAARFLQRSIQEVRDPSITLSAPSYPGAQLRRVRQIDQDRLSSAIHAALQIAGAVTRSLKNTAQTAVIPSPNAFDLRNEILQVNNSVSLDDLLGNLWNRGIPVIPVDILPEPNFQGLACVISGRPVILLGHKLDAPGRIAFIVAHEVGHIASGDCTPDHPIVDEEDEVDDRSAIEKSADLFASRILAGKDSIPKISGASFQDLAQNAYDLEHKTGAEAGFLIWSWARQTKNYAQATMAVKALYRGQGGRTTLRRYFDRFIDLDLASESDRSLLRCVYGDPAHNEITD